MGGACQDITDLKKLQRESFERQKLESVGTLASGIAHDFNNLLGSMLAQADLALADPGSYPKEELTGIREVAIRGAEIVRQLMIYAGKENDAVGLVDVSRIVKEMTELLRFSVSKRAVLMTRLENDLPAVLANTAQLQQVVMNLVTNASDAIGDRDGVIRVTTGRLTGGPGAAVSQRWIEGDYVQLEVFDTGCGMSPEMQARVFDPFFTTKSGGHGLGLAVVHGIVRGLRGAIHLTSEPGKGTTFKVLLPCAEGQADPTSDLIPDAVGPVRSCQGFTLLVVEDEDTLRQAVAKMLRKTGCEVLEATNGSAAIDLLSSRRGKIDVMLLDMTIPGASSHEVLAAVARDRPEIKVVLTSAYSREMLTTDLSASQVRGFIRKPFQVADLLQTLRNALSS
jgi:nitrogen-specific signal transduction histidine kinase